jgi:hypothetical protein
LRRRVSASRSPRKKVILFKRCLRSCWERWQLSSRHITWVPAQLRWPLRSEISECSQCPEASFFGKLAINGIWPRQQLIAYQPSMAAFLRRLQSHILSKAINQCAKDYRHSYSSPNLSFRRHLQGSALSSIAPDFAFAFEYEHIP